MPVLSRTGPAFLPFGLYEASGNWLETGVTKVKLTQSVVEAATPMLSARHSSGTGKPASTRLMASRIWLSVNLDFLMR